MLNRYLLRIVFCIVALAAVGEASGNAASVPGGSPQQPEPKIISNPKTPVPPAGKRKSLVFTPELTIGQKEGDENYMFGESVSFNTDEQGNFYVTDWDRKRIQKYDPAGKYLLTIGRQGQGPGEFQNLSVARFDKDGNIYVSDYANQRISFFDRKGTYLRQIRLPDVYEDLYINSRGQFVSSHSVNLTSEGNPGWKIEYGLFDEQFKPLVELHTQEFHYKPPAGRDATSMARFQAELISGMAFQPMAAQLLRKDDFIFFGFPKEYAVDLFTPEGRKVKTIRREFEPSKITDKDKDYFVNRTAEPFMSRIALRSEEIRKDTIKFIEYPKFKPAYIGFAPMENGWLLVTVEILPGEGALFDLFDEEGRYVGQFKSDFPGDAQHFFKNGKAYAVVEEEGYKFVRRYSFSIQDY
jgi:hypothetical protein